MDEHLTREQIAAMLDEPRAVPWGAGHLDVCPECAGEYEAMSRTRMALSGLTDLAAPEGAWERLAPALRDVEISRDRLTAGPPRWWLRAQQKWTPALTAASIALLFLGGLGVGRMLGPSEAADPPADPVATAETPEFVGEPRGGGGVAGLGGYPEYQRSVAGLQALRADGPTIAELATDPAAAAERLTRLDALIEASREALRTAPADPALNDFLFDVVDERASVAGQLNQTIRQASMEY